MAPTPAAWNRERIAFGAGVLLLAAGIVVAVVSGLEPAALKVALTMSFIGLAVVLFGTERSLPQDFVEAQLLAEAEQRTRLLAGLQLRGNAIHVPATADRPDQIFVPAAKQTPTGLPPLDGETVVHNGSAHPTVGLALPPPGVHHLGLVERRHGIQLAGTPQEQVEERLALVASEGRLARDVRVDRQSGAYLLAFRHDRFADLCRATSALGDQVATQGGCLACATLSAGLARCLGTPLRVTDHRLEGTHVTIRLEAFPE